MKYLFTVIWGIICVMVLAYGHFHWQQQTAVKAVVEPGLTQEASETDYTEYLKLAANWPQSAKEQFQLALKEEKPFKILFVGSTAMEWEKNVTQRLTESFGSDKVVSAFHTYEQTSDDIFAENIPLELAAEKAQLVVIEPFLFNDNGNVKIDVTLANVTKLMEDIKASNPATTFILQPSYPIYKPKYYSTQIEALKEYAAANGLTYLDHWAAWPATDNPEIKNYLTDDESAPNEQGNQVWAQFLTDYFVTKKAN
ncbi:SGNH/GDSL hydrolase family protein [Neobacillus sp. 3P2-tot-E-2]|uniref:SGNH/GDSL hydrolase family protein n=1 Tax=Neobacillus sp. 3P2-tot-E-2 TaxID=3132212 RepID=UPI0039A35B18